MQAIEISQAGAPDVLRLVERAAPVAGAGEVLIKVAASGVNRPDVLQRKGAYAPPPDASDLPGLEVAGHIVGGDVDAMAGAGLKVGDAVCALAHGGGYAELCAVAVGHCLPWPKGFDAVQAASLPETFFTVWANVFDRSKLQAGETLVVHGGTSGIGVCAIQMGKAWGCTVIATAGSAEKVAACLSLGADHAINYQEQDFAAEVLRITANRGADVILDMVAGPYVARGVSCLADDGRLALIAVQGGVDAQFNAGLVLRKRLSISGSTLRPRTVAYKSHLAAGLRANIWPLLDSGVIKPVIHSVFDARVSGNAAKAHALMESSVHVGKIMLKW